MRNALLRSGKLTALTSAVFAVALSGQSKPGPATTKSSRTAVVQIGDHRLGETFSEWLAIKKIDLDAVCRNGARSNEIARQGYPANSSAEDIQKGFMDLHQSQEDGRMCDDLRPIRDTGSGEFHDRRGLPFDAEVGDRWTFANGKLAKKQNVYSTEIATKELGSLKEAYGPPALITKTPQQNAFGAKWNDVLVTWHLPGGATLYMNALGGPNDDLIITFVSREYANRPVSREPNPYLPTKP